MKQKVLFEIKCIEWITDYWESLLVPRVCLDQWELILFLDVKILQQPPLQGKCAEILRPLDLIYDKIKKRKCACFIINRDTNESRVLCLSWVNQHKNDLLFHSVKARVFLRNYGIIYFHLRAQCPHPNEEPPTRSWSCQPQAWGCVWRELRVAVFQWTALRRIFFLKRRLRNNSTLKSARSCSNIKHKFVCVVYDYMHFINFYT